MKTSNRANLLAKLEKARADVHESSGMMAMSVTESQVSRYAHRLAAAETRRDEAEQELREHDSGILKHAVWDSVLVDVREELEWFRSAIEELEAWRNQWDESESEEAWHDTAVSIPNSVGVIEVRNKAGDRCRLEVEPNGFVYVDEHGESWSPSALDVDFTAWRPVNEEADDE